MTCHTLSFNHNQLVALPRCLANMINLTALSANDNKISFLPSNFGDSRSLTVLNCVQTSSRSSRVDIEATAIEESLWLDHNAPMAALPWNFYMLTSLVELRMDANPGMKYPTPDTLLQGAEAVRNWFKKRQKTGLIREETQSSSDHAGLHGAM